MRTIISIEWVEEREKSGKKYWRTHVILDNGEIAVGYGKDFDLQDKVEVFYDRKWDTIKMKKPSLK